jgi:hypothetical protein
MFRLPRKRASDQRRDSFFSVTALARTPVPIVQRLNGEINRPAKTPMAEKLESHLLSGVRVA